MKRHLNKIRNKIIKGKGDTDFKDIIIGGFYSLGAKIWFVIASLLTQFIISRYYGAALVGKIAIINNMIHVLTIFTVFGFNISILKHIPDHKVRFSFSSALKVYSKISKIIFAFSMISVIVVFFLAEYIAIHIFNKSDLTIFIRIGSVFILPYSLKVFYDSGFKAFKKVKKLAQIVTISNTLKILLVGLCAYFALNEIYPFVFVFLALLITATGGYFYFKKNIFSKFDSNENIKNESYKALFLFSLPMVFIATSNLLNHNINILILGRYMTAENVGYFNIASKFTGLISFGLLAVNSVAAAKFSEYYSKKDFKGLKKTARMATLPIFFIAFPLTLGFIIFGKFILSLYGLAFTIAYPALVLLSIGKLIKVSTGSVGWLLNMSGNHKTYMIIIIISTIFNIAFNFILIPIYGLVGAAIATMASDILTNITALILVRIRLGFWNTFF